VPARAVTRGRLTVKDVAVLYDDVEWCARTAGLTYVDPESPGVRRVRRGKGFSYRRSGDRPVSDAVRSRIQALAIPPAWREVWICPDPSGHIQAVGVDERGRRQYLYHARWRELRDLLNFYRLVGFGEALPAVRSDVEAQLRRRSLDRELVVATMLRTVDVCGLRAGSEVYAEENDSFGLTTLARRHVVVDGRSVRFSFPAKSGRRAAVELVDSSVARVVGQLSGQGGSRLFAVDGVPIDADDLNERLEMLSGARITLKDFRTWRGTRVAFCHLRAHLDIVDRAGEALSAIDAAAESLGNTRAVARAHYVHPHLLDAYMDGSLDTFLKGSRRRASRHLDADEATLLRFLTHALQQWNGGIPA
jgi:DNA topoisomerase I